jgi:hypothetical protein
VWRSERAVGEEEEVIKWRVGTRKRESTRVSERREGRERRVN